MKFSTLALTAVVCASSTMMPTLAVSSDANVADADQSIFLEDSFDFEQYWSTFSDDPNDGKTNLIVSYTSQKGYNNLLSMQSIQVVKEFPEDGYVAIEVKNEQLDVVMQQLVADPDIEAVEKDSLWVEQGFLHSYVSEDEVRRMLRSSGTDEDQRKLQGETTPYGIKMVQGDQLSVGSSKVTVCIVDTGVASAHPDLNYNKISGVSRNSNMDGAYMVWNNDVRGHGTHISGTIAAKINNGIGVRGMGDIPLYITRGLSSTGTGRESDIRDAIQQCEAAGAKVISLSLAGSSITDAMKTIIERLYSEGFLIFAASGNGGGNNIAFPAAHPKVIAVGAVSSDGTRWTGSNYGYNELSAPGNLVLSTTVNSAGQNVYANYSGTSMATPHAAGAAALLWSHFPKCSNNQIRYALAYTAKDVGSSGCDQTYGYGIVQVKAAYNFLSKYSCSNANWGKKVSTNDQCSTIDTKPSSSSIIFSSWWSK
jgi:subtilisin family serine protease